MKYASCMTWASEVGREEQKVFKEAITENFPVW
jgi:hypothetical protein